MKPDEKLMIGEKMKIDQKEFDVLKENQMVKLLIEVEKMSATAAVSPDISMHRYQAKLLFENQRK